MIFGILSFLFLIVCIVLIFLILVQDDKGGGISGAIGGGASSTANTILGSQNAENILTYGTRIFALVFFVLTIIIALWVSNGSIGSPKSTISELKEYTAGVSDVAPANENAIMPFVVQDEPNIEVQTVPLAE